MANPNNDQERNNSLRHLTQKTLNIFNMATATEKKKIIKSCIDKERHPSRAAARAAIKRNQAKHEGTKSTFYSCNICGEFHLTTVFRGISN
jgi:hypothetical protein